MRRERMTILANQALDSGALSNVVQDLEGLGFEVQDSIPEIHMLIGVASIDPSGKKLADFKRVNGVVSVDLEETLSVMPPSSDGPF